jgi:tuftelin-interacting protein 11
MYTNDDQIDTFSRLFEQLRLEFKDEYDRYDIASLAVAHAVPIMKRLMAAWNPLKEPSMHSNLFRRLKPLLESRRRETQQHHYTSGESLMAPFESLIYTLWLPRVRTSLNNEWVVHDSDSAVQLLDVWMDLLPPFIVQNIVDQLIMPKLHRAIDHWGNLKTEEPVPIHCWLHPWLPLLGDELQPFYIQVRHRLTSYLSDWKPQDAYAYDLIAPWKDVFCSDDLTKLLKKRILPQLRQLLRDFVIDPTQQLLEPFQSVSTTLGG